MEQYSRDKNHRKDAIEGSNASILYCCCWCCFSIVATADNCVETNITTKFITQNKDKNINQIRANLYGS